LSRLNSFGANRWVLRCAFFLLITVFSIVTLFSISSNNTYGDIRLVGSSYSDYKAEAGYTVKIPLFDRGFANVRGQMGLSLTTLELNVDANFSFFDFLEVGGGGKVGTGWNFSGTEYKGLAIGDGISSAESNSLGGVYFNGYGKVTLKYQTGELFKNQWLNFLLQTTQMLSYDGYIASKESIGWEFSYNGLHSDGANYKGSYLIGYQMMDIPLNLIGIEFVHRYDNIKNEFDIGSMYEINIVTNVDIGKRSSLKFIGQTGNYSINETKRTIEKNGFHFRGLKVIMSFTF
jgi:hypothetical protein